MTGLWTESCKEGCKRVGRVCVAGVGAVVGATLANKGRAGCWKNKVHATMGAERLKAWGDVRGMVRILCFACASTVDVRSTSTTPHGDP